MSIGIQELFLIGVIALIILGPERLPNAIKTCMVWVSRIKRGFNDIKTELEREIDTEDIRRQIHNENVLHEINKTGADIKESLFPHEESLDGEKKPDEWFCKRYP